MRSEDRRELVLAAATAVFGERGYFGATTDQVAKAAGVSQPYVVRMFGSKEELFLAVVGRALERLLATFRSAIAEAGPAGSSGVTAVTDRMAQSYAELLADRGLLLSLMHGFLLGTEPVIGERMRDGFGQIYALLRDEAGLSPEEARVFLADGMLLNTLVSLQLAREVDTDAAFAELLACALPTKLDLIRGLGTAR